MTSVRNSRIFTADDTDYNVTAYNAFGLYENAEGRAWVHVSTKLDSATAANGIVISFSEDGETEAFRETLSYLTVGSTQFDTVPAHGRYVRLSLLTAAAVTLNGAIAVKYSDSHPGDVTVTRMPEVEALLTTIDTDTGDMAISTATAAISTANALAAWTQAPVVVNAKASTSVLAGDVETALDLNAGTYRANQITVQGSTSSLAYAFILQFSTNGAAYFSDGVQPELYDAGGGFYTFSLTRDPVLCQYVRVLHLTDGDNLTMDIITARR
jgi:hypothetical protein